MFVESVPTLLHCTLVF